MSGDITEEVSGSMAEIAGGIAEITTAIHSVNELVQNNKISTDALIERVNKFKIR